MSHDCEGCEDCKRKDAEESLAKLLREAVEAERAACAEVAKRFIIAGAETPYVNGMNDSATRIYQCITARGMKDD